MPDERVDVNLTDLDETAEDVVIDDVDDDVEGIESGESETKTEETEEVLEEEPETEDWDEWRSQEELPDSIDSPEKLAESYRESLREMKRAQTATQRIEQVEAMLKSQGFHGGIDGLMSGQAPQPQQPQRAVPPSPPTGGDTYFKPNPVRSVVDGMIQEGGIEDSAQQSFRGIARVIDKAITPQFQLAEQVMTTAMQQIQMMRNQMQGMQWAGLDPQMKGVVDRGEADRLINSGMVGDYAEAARWLAFKNGNVLSTVSEKAEERGKAKAKKKFRRSKALRKGKKVASERFNYSNYQDRNGEWDLGKLSASGKGDKILEAWEKEFGK